MDEGFGLGVKLKVEADVVFRVAKDGIDGAVLNKRVPVDDVDLVVAHDAAQLFQLVSVGGEGRRAREDISHGLDVVGHRGVADVKHGFEVVLVDGDLLLGIVHPQFDHGFRGTESLFRLKVIGQIEERGESERHGNKKPQLK